MKKNQKKNIKQTFGGHKSVLKIVSGVFFKYKLLDSVQTNPEY